MNELKAISEINEEIKDIVSVAESISLTATNAMLVAKQTGAYASGFTMVARELRAYSERMTAALQELSKLIYWQVEVNATKRHRVRKQNLLSKTGTYGELAQTRINLACTRGLLELDEIERLIVTQVRDLQLMVKRAGKQCTTGLVIARSACIEAAYGGDMALVLSQIAHDVEEVVHTLSRRVMRLELRLSEIGL
jgi:methyl-accepting chemotaxis protein